MGKKIFKLALLWSLTILAYIILAAAFPAIQTITADVSSNLTATSNMTNYPGMLEAVDSAPLWMWFIPGLVSVVLTVMLLMAPDP